MKEKMKEETINRLNELLDNYFSHIGKKFGELRPEQIRAVRDILDHKDVMVVMPTAGGKSLCFQLPALYWNDSVTIVISPLRALIREQVRELNRHAEVAAIIGSPAAMDIYYNVQGYEADEQMKEQLNGIINGKYRLVYITPEMLTNNIFLRVIRRIRNRIKMIAVDEAHCVSMWGYSFRPSYLNIRNFIESFDVRPIISAFTATATTAVISDTVKTLGLHLERQPNKNKDAYDRNDLIYHVYEIKKKEDASEKKTDRERTIGYWKGQRIVSLIKDYMKSGEQGLIFCATPKEVESIYSYLNRAETGYEGKVSRYYGNNMSNEERKKNLDAFLKKETLVMTATNAFGMGINMPGLRYVIHYNIPLCLENYCQEAGRAARGENITGDCYLLYTKKDERICRELINKNPYPDRRKIAHERFKKMIRYAQKGEERELTNDILHKRIGDYFTGNELGKKDWDSNGNTGIPLYVNRTYVANEIRKGNFENDRLRFRGTKSYVSYRLYDPQTDETASLSYFDMMIADAVYSLWLNNRPITHKSIWILLSGDNRVSVQKEKKEKIIDSLKRMSSVCIRIEQHIGGSYGVKLEDEENTEILEGTFLPFEEEPDLNSKGSLILKGIPPLYLYAEIQGQFHVFDGEQMRLRLVESKEVTDDRKSGKTELRYYLKLDSDGNEIKMQSSIGNTILKHYLLRRIDLISQAGMDQKVVKKEGEKRAKNPQKKKRQGVLSNRINYFSDSGVSILESLGMISPDTIEDARYQYKYKYKRFHEEILGAGIPRKGKRGQTVTYEPANKGNKKPRIEQMLDYYIWLAQERNIGNLSGYESRIHDDEIIYGKKLPYTQICLDAYSGKSKQRYKIDEKKKGNQGI